MDTFQGEKYIILIILINLLWMIASSFLNIYEIYRVINLERIITNLIKTVLFHGLLIAIFIVALKGHYYSRKFLLIFYWFYFTFVTVFRLTFLLIIRRLQAKGFNTRNAVIIGAGPVGLDIMKLLVKNKEYGYNFLGFFDDNGLQNHYSKYVLGNLSEIEEYTNKYKIEEIFCALPLSAVDKIRQIREFAENNLIRFKIVPDFRGFYNQKASLEFYGRIPIMRIRKEPLENTINTFVKRIFDILFSLFVIVFVLSWLIPIIAIIIKIDSKGPVFYKQRRSGERNRLFTCFKFRTMNYSQNSEFIQAKKDDPRITKVGRFLRKNNLDEFPQFLNVFLGHMTVVGPRPHPMKLNEEYKNIIDKYMIRHLVKPGITGWAQIHGYRGETDNVRKMYKRVQYDVWYIENWTFLLDIKIIIQTVINMFKGDKNAI